jgi:hypothetical protein
MSTYMNRAILAKLREVVDLPPGLVSLELSLKLGCFPEIVATFFVTAPDGADVDHAAHEPVTQRFRLVRLDTDA